MEKLVVKILFILAFIPCFINAQQGVVLRNDTLFSFDPETNTYTQINKQDTSALPGFTNKVKGLISWNNVTGKPASYTPSSHNHVKADITDFGSPLYSIDTNDISGFYAKVRASLGTLALQSGTFSGTSSGTNTGDQTISDATISTTDITTNNVSTSKHGFAPKGNGSSTSYLDGTGAYSTPSATTGSFTILSGDVTNNNASANTIADVTGLSFAVTSGITYKFKFFIVYTSAATTTGSRWSINGPSTTFLNYRSTYTLTATSETLNTGVAAYNLPSGASASSLASNNIAIIEGIIKPSANGTVIARFASEVSSSAIVAKANQSYVEFQIIN